MMYDSFALIIDIDLAHTFRWESLFIFCEESVVSKLSSWPSKVVLPLRHPLCGEHVGTSSGGCESFLISVGQGFVVTGERVSREARASTGSPASGGACCVACGLWHSLGVPPSLLERLRSRSGITGIRR